MKVLIYALGIAMFIEGVPYLAFPSKAKQMLHTLIAMSDNSLRVVGGALVIAGFLILYFV